MWSHLHGRSSPRSYFPPASSETGQLICLAGTVAAKFGFNMICTLSIFSGATFGSWSIIGLGRYFSMLPIVCDSKISGLLYNAGSINIRSSRKFAANQADCNQTVPREYSKVSSSLFEIEPFWLSEDEPLLYLTLWRAGHLTDMILALLSAVYRLYISPSEGLLWVGNFKVTSSIQQETLS